MGKRRSLGPWLILLIIVSYSFFHLYQALGPIGFWILAAFALTGVIYWITKNQRKAHAAFQELALKTIKHRTNPDAARSIKSPRTKKDFPNYALIRNLQIIKDSIDIALMSKKRDVADSRMNLALKLWGEIEDKYFDLLSNENKKTIKEIVSEAHRRFQTDIYLNLARAHIEKVNSLRTDKAKERYRLLAREVISEGLANPQSDKKKLEDLLSQIFQPKTSS